MLQHMISRLYRLKGKSRHGTLEPITDGPTQGRCYCDVSEIIIVCFFAKLTVTNYFNMFVVKYQQLPPPPNQGVMFVTASVMLGSCQI